MNNRYHKHHRILASAALVVASTVSFGADAIAQSRVSMLFTPKGDETTQSGSGGTVLGTITRRAIAVVTPGGSACKYSAEKFGPLVAHQTLVGDEDGDGDVHTPNLFGALQALLVTQHVWDARIRSWRPRSKPITLRDVNITPKVALGTNVSGAPGLRPCDSGRIVPDGRIRHFIRGEQIIASLGLVDKQRKPLKPDALSLDAITVDKAGNIYLSFEEDHTMIVFCGGSLATFSLQDGGVAMIPGAAWTKTTDGDVAAVAARRGRMLLSEARVDAMQSKAKLADVAGACPTAIIDLDGLAIDHRGGTFTKTWCKSKMQIPHLLFSTEAYTGAGVASTRNGGEIAGMNGCALATGCSAAGTPTDGKQAGLKPGKTVSSLDGLVTLDREPCRFVIGTPDAQTLGGNCTWVIGTNLNVPSVLLFAGNGGLPVSPSLGFTATLGMPTNCFPDFFPSVFTYGPIPVALAADGWGGRVGTLGPFPVPVAAAPNGLLSQAFVNVNGRWQLSTPATHVKK